MSCELSCSVLGFIPCSKYRNRRTCTIFYPNAIGSYKNGLVYKQNLFTSLFYDSSSRMIYISGKGLLCWSSKLCLTYLLLFFQSITGAISTLILLLIIVFVVVVCMRKRNLICRLSRSGTRSSEPRKQQPNALLNHSSVTHNMPKNSYEKNEEPYYEEHKYQEISDIDDYNDTTSKQPFVAKRFHTFAPYNTVATLKNSPSLITDRQDCCYMDSKIKGKSTYV
jgi:hypothetical protein